MIPKPLAPATEHLSPAEMTSQIVRARAGHEHDGYLPEIDLPGPDELRAIAAGLAPGESKLVGRLDEPASFDPRDEVGRNDRVRVVLTRTTTKISRRTNGDLSVLIRRAEHRIGHTGTRFNPYGGGRGTPPVGPPRPFSTWRTASLDIYTARPGGYWIHQQCRASTAKRAGRWVARLVFAESGAYCPPLVRQILPTPAAVTQVYPLLDSRLAAVGPNGVDAARVLASVMRGLLHRAFLGAADFETVTRRLFGQRAYSLELAEAVAEADVSRLAAVARFRALVRAEHLIEALGRDGDAAANGDAHRFAWVLRFLDDGSLQRLLDDHIGTQGGRNRLPSPLTTGQKKALHAGRIRLGPVACWEDVSARLNDVASCFTPAGRIERIEFDHDTPGNRGIEGTTEAGLRLRWAQTMAQAWEWGTGTNLWKIAGRAPRLLGCFDEQGALVATICLRQNRVESIRTTPDVEGTGYGSTIHGEIEDHLRSIGVEVDTVRLAA